jgi:hypothetical protein
MRWTVFFVSLFVLLSLCLASAVANEKDKDVTETDGFHSPETKVGVIRSCVHMTDSGEHIIDGATHVVVKTQEEIDPSAFKPPNRSAAASGPGLSILLGALVAALLLLFGFFIFRHFQDKS